MRKAMGCLSVIAILAAGVLSTFDRAAADTWPERTVRVIVTTGAGAGSDVAARLFADRLAARWKRPVIVENRPGADGLIGTAAFTTLRDDHALLFSIAAPITILPLTHDKLPYDPAHDLVPISAATETFGTVAVAASLKIGSLRQFVARARSEPGKFNYYGGAGALPFTFAGFVRQQGLDMVRVSYREFNLGMQDLVQGRLHVMASTMTGFLPAVQAEKVHFLAVTNSTRAPIAPAVPTVIEAGYPELAFDGLAGFFGPRGISIERLHGISEDIRAAAADPVLSDRLIAAGQRVHAGTPTEFSAALEKQREKMAAIANLVGGKPQ